MTTPQDLCGLSGCHRIETYGRAELFLYLIGSGVTRVLFALTAHDAQTRALLFDLQMEADAEALAARARQAGNSADEEAIAITLGCARRIVDADAFRQAAHFRLRVTRDGGSLSPASVEI